MKVLLVNTFGHGGAANSCIRLHKGLRQIGIESTLLVLDDSRGADVSFKEVFPRTMKAVSWKMKNSIWDRLKKGKVMRRKEIERQIQANIPDKIEWYSFPDTGFDITEHPAYKDSDVINLHWVSGFLDYRSFERIDKPVVWTFHDMNAFTGGCHYSGSCRAYETACRECPQLNVIHREKFVSELFQFKKKSLPGNSHLQIVTPSTWLTGSSKASSLMKNFKHQTIAYGIDSTVFVPNGRAAMRSKLGVTDRQKLILFVAFNSLTNKRKGFDILLSALNHLQQENVCLVAVGGKSAFVPENTAVHFVDYGFVKNENEMAQLYTAADIFVIPSIEDNLPNTVIESLLCGTPVIGFRIGGMPDMVSSGFNGMLADEPDAHKLSASIQNALDAPEQFDREKIRRDAVERFDLKVQANRYSDLFADVLEKTKNN